MVVPGMVLPPVEATETLALSTERVVPPLVPTEALALTKDRVVPPLEPTEALKQARPRRQTELCGDVMMGEVVAGVVETKVEEAVRLDGGMVDWPPITGWPDVLGRTVVVMVVQVVEIDDGTVVVDVKDGIEVTISEGEVLVLKGLLRERLPELVPEVLGLLTDELVTLSETLAEMLANVLDTPAEMLAEILGVAVDAPVERLTEMLGETLPEMLLLDTLGGRLETLPEILGRETGTLAELLGDTLLPEVLGRELETLVEPLKRLLGALAETLAEMLAAVLDTPTEMLAEILSGVVEIPAKVLCKILGDTTLLETVGDEPRITPEPLGRILETLAETLAETIAARLEAVVEILGEMLTAVVENPPEALAEMLGRMLGDILALVLGVMESRLGPLTVALAVALPETLADKLADMPGDILRAVPEALAERPIEALSVALLLTKRDALRQRRSVHEMVEEGDPRALATLPVSDPIVPVGLDTAEPEFDSTDAVEDPLSDIEALGHSKLVHEVVGDRLPTALEALPKLDTPEEATLDVETPEVAGADAAEPVPVEIAGVDDPLSDKDALTHSRPMHEAVED